MGSFQTGCTVKKTKGILSKEYKYEKYSVQARIYKGRLYVFSKANTSSKWLIEDIIKIENISRRYFPTMKEIQIGLRKSQQTSMKLYGSLNIVYGKYHMDSVKTKLEWLIILSTLF